MWKERYVMQRHMSYKSGRFMGDVKTRVSFVRDNSPICRHRYREDTADVTLLRGDELIWPTEFLTDRILATDRIREQSSVFEDVMYVSLIDEIERKRQARPRTRRIVFTFGAIISSSDVCPRSIQILNQSSRIVKHARFVNWSRWKTARRKWRTLSRRKIAQT